MVQLVTDSILGLAPYQGGKPIEELARERGLVDIVKLASNESALGASPRAIEAARNALNHVHRYPDGAGYRLRKAIADFQGVPLDEVLHGNGSNELLELIVRTFTTSEHHIIFGRPAFSMYSVIAAGHNVSYTAVATDEHLVHRLESMLDAVVENTKVIIIDNPNNPTGTYVPQAKLESFLKRVPSHIIVVLDEAYFEFADATDYPNGLKLRALHENLIILRTFSKAYGLAGFRVGYGIGPSVLMNFINRLRAPFNVSLISQEAAIAALSDVSHLSAVVALNNSERQRMIQLLAPFGHVYPSQANFVLVDFKQPSAELYDRLLDEGLIVRPIPGLTTYLRITLGTETENNRLVAALHKVIG
jgi:histidinol-phosphate aminotransferase